VPSHTVFVDQCSSTVFKWNIYDGNNVRLIKESLTSQTLIKACLRRQFFGDIIQQEHSVETTFNLGLDVDSTVILRSFYIACLLGRFLRHNEYLGKGHASFYAEQVYFLRDISKRSS
jgi:hypothetical protein